MKPAARDVIKVSTHVAKLEKNYRYRSISARRGRRRLNPTKPRTGGVITWPRYTDGVSVDLAEFHPKTGTVWLGIYSAFTNRTGVKRSGAFEECITADELDDLIDLLAAIRDKARDLKMLGGTDGGTRRNRRQRKAS
ncbi:MAG: hypothetical protein ACRENK_17005 [Gemmatimonadaceae bacterium]